MPFLPVREGARRRRPGRPADLGDYVVGTDHLIPRQKLWDLELEQLYKERETTDPDPEMWRWSPLELWEFDRMLTVATQLFDGLRQLSFCEAGCGIGTKLYLASRYHNLRATGFEI